MKSTRERLVAVRIGPDSSTVALVDPNGARIVRAIQLPGGLRRMDGRIARIVSVEFPGGLPMGNSTALLAARARLNDAIAAARMRLVDDETTTVSVRFPGRMAFVTLEREAVIAELLPEIAPIRAAVAELDADAVIALNGVAGVPGLMDALPARLTTAAEHGIGDPESLFDLDDRGKREPDGPVRDTEGITDVRPESAGPVPSGAEQAGAVADSGRLAPIAPPSAREVVRAEAILRLAWPVAFAVVAALALAGMATATGLGASTPGADHSHAPATIHTDRNAATTGGRQPTSGPTAPSVGPTVTDDGAPPPATAPQNPPKPGRSAGTTAPPAVAGPGTGGQPAPDPGASIAPTPPADPTDPPSGSPSPSPSPSPEDTDGGSILGLPILPPLP